MKVTINTGKQTEDGVKIMSKISNNIFSFATKELSQDAVICWILNWIKYPESNLHGLSKELFQLLGVGEIDVHQEITIKQQLNKADIVIALHGQKQIVIIEDKVYSSEHDNQIEEYAKHFRELNNQKDLLKNNTGVPYSIKTVYFKTGYYYDIDKMVVADVTINATQFYNIVSSPRYSNKSEILDAYVEHLKGVMDYYKKYGDYRKRYEDGGFYISWEAIAQHNLMRTIFPEEKWDRKTKAFMVETGSSSGRPWAETNICAGIRHKESEDIFYYFWRIDTNNSGPYLSLRLYDWFDKKDEAKKKRHIELYDLCIDKSKKVFENLQSSIELCWDDVKEGYRGNYVESSLFAIKLSDYLLNWDTKGESLIKDVNAITTAFLKEINC